MMLNPEGTQSVFDLEDGLLKSKSTDELLRFTSKDPTVRSLIDERYLQPIAIVSMSTLRRFATSKNGSAKRKTGLRCRSPNRRSHAPMTESVVESRSS